MPATPGVAKRQHQWGIPKCCSYATQHLLEYQRDNPILGGLVETISDTKGPRDQWRAREDVRRGCRGRNVRGRPSRRERQADRVEAPPREEALGGDNDIARKHLKKPRRHNLT